MFADVDTLLNLSLREVPWGLMVECWVGSVDQMDVNWGFSRKLSDSSSCTWPSPLNFSLSFFPSDYFFLKTPIRKQLLLPRIQIQIVDLL